MPEVGAPEGGDRFNHVFERLVPREGDEKLLGMIAYARYKQAKREWCQKIWEVYHRKPTEEELIAYASTWTDSRLEGAKIEALSVLDDFGASVTRQVKPGIIAEANKQNFGREVWAAVVGAVCYTAGVVAIAFFIKYVGVDLFHQLETFARSVGENVGHQQSPAPPH